MIMVGELPPIPSSGALSKKQDKERRNATRHSFDEGWRLKLPKLKESDRTRSEPLLFQHEENLASEKSKRKKLGRSLAERLGSILAKTKNRSTMIKKGSNYSKFGPIQKTNNAEKATGVKLRTGGKFGECDPKPKTLEPIVIEEPFSIRKKIEQFRKWHEEQAKSRLSKHSPENRESYKSKSEVKQESICSKKPLVNLAEERLQAKKEDPGRAESPPARVDLAEIERISSAKTWRTFRDVNDSYAYSDVKLYIRENKLLPPDKESWILNWVKDVHITTEIPEET